MSLDNFRTFLENNAFSSAYKLRLRYPELEISIYQEKEAFYLRITNEIANYAALEKEFREEIKPVGYPLFLVLAAPPGAICLSPREIDYKSELWLKGQAVTPPVISTLLSISNSKIPKGAVDYEQDKGAWVYRTGVTLSETEVAAIQEGARSIGLDGPIVIETISPSSPQGQQVPFEGLVLTPASAFRSTQGAAIKALVEEDDEHWRTFLNQRSNRQEEQAPPKAKKQFSCLFNLGDHSELRLSELLTIYDHVHLIPEPLIIGWNERHRLDMQQIQELVSLGRISFVLPGPAAKYSSDLLNAVYEADPAAITMSRRLLSESILKAQRKNPLLYGPFNSEERVLLLALMSKDLTTDWARGIVSFYRNAFSDQHTAYMTKGAHGLLTHGIGPMIGHMYHYLNKQDVRIEAGVNGASIEWALGLGASYIPRKYANGYDETHNSLIISSFMGSHPKKNADPLTNRMHTVTNGLLAAHDVPPVEVARNFNSAAIQRFRSVAMRLMHETTSQEELDIAITALNQDVVSLERRKEKLVQYKLNHLGSGLVGGAIGNAIDEHAFPLASVFSAWLYEVLKEKLGPSIDSRIGEMGAILTGLLTGNSMDAVIVSRARQQLRQ